jgi:hypothetical protein
MESCPHAAIFDATNLFKGTLTLWLYNCDLLPDPGPLDFLSIVYGTVLNMEQMRNNYFCMMDSSSSLTQASQSADSDIWLD